jgi:hypothetical protein
VGLLSEPTPGVPQRTWALIGLAMAFMGILLALAGKFSNAQWLLYAGVFISITGMFSIAAISLLRPARSRKRVAPAIVQPELISKADTTNKLLPVSENNFIPSVVEGTTQLLKIPVEKDTSGRA